MNSYIEKTRAGNPVHRLALCCCVKASNLRQFVFFPFSLSLTHTQAVPPTNATVREDVNSAELQHEKQKVMRLSETNDELSAEVETLEKQLRDKEAHATSLESQLKEKVEAEAEQQQLESELKNLQDKYRGSRVIQP